MVRKSKKVQSTPEDSVPEDSRGSSGTEIEAHPDISMLLDFTGNSV